MTHGAQPDSVAILSTGSSEDDQATPRKILDAFPVRLVSPASIVIGRVSGVPESLITEFTIYRRKLKPKFPGVRTKTYGS